MVEGGRGRAVDGGRWVVHVHCREVGCSVGGRGRGSIVEGCRKRDTHAHTHTHTHTHKA